MVTLIQIMLINKGRLFFIILSMVWLSFFLSFFLSFINHHLNHHVLFYFSGCLAVYQIWSQFPLAFEFNDQFLMDILDHVTSLRFGTIFILLRIREFYHLFQLFIGVAGTFLYDSQKKRQQGSVPARTVSLWTYMLCMSNCVVFCSSSFHVPMFFVVCLF